MRCVCLASLDSRSIVDAVLGWALGDRLGLLSGCGALELLADGLDGGGAGAADGSSAVDTSVYVHDVFKITILPAEVGVDASKDLSVVGLDVLDDNGAGDGVLAVAASTVKLAEVNDG